MLKGEGAIRLNIQKKTISEVREIIKNTPAALKGRQISEFTERLQIGYAMKSTANWSYQVWAVLHNGFIISVVSVFGKIK